MRGSKFRRKFQGISHSGLKGTIYRRDERWGGDKTTGDAIWVQLVKKLQGKKENILVGKKTRFFCVLSPNEPFLYSTYPAL